MARTCITNRNDYERLIGLIQAEVGDPMSANAFVQAMLADSPRANDIRGRLNLNGNPRNVAVMLEAALCTFGQDVPGRSVHVLLIDELKRRGGAQDHDFLNTLTATYSFIRGIESHDAHTNSGIERLVRQTNSFFDIAQWREKLAVIERQVCRVETRTSFGTGFLVAPDVVMTNQHVIADVNDPASVTLRFDYKQGTSGANDGETFALRAKNWLLLSSPTDDVDAVPMPKPREAAPDKLDCALLRVKGSPGKARGWVRPANPQHDFKNQPALFIVQHPKGQPMKLALDTEAVVAVNQNGSRVHYRTNTEPGSSGSPCFNQNWELVALHHSGEPAQVATWNEGIPIKAIYAWLEAQGKMSLLAATEAVTQEEPAEGEPPLNGNAESDLQFQTRLRDILVSRFNLGELQTLCFDLGEDAEVIGGLDDKATFARRMVLHFAQRERLAELRGAVKKARPNAAI